MADQDVGDLSADRADRVEGRARALEDDRQFAPADFGHRLLARLQQVEPAEHDVPRGNPRGCIENAHYRVGGHRLARAAFADQA